MWDWLNENGFEYVFSAPLQTFYDMSKDWYRGRMDEEWNPHSAEDAMAIWSSHGLTGDFWTL